MRKSDKPKRRGRRDHATQVAAAKKAASDAGLRDLLTRIAGDPDAGVWRPWAEELLDAPEVRAEPGPTGRQK